MNLSDTNTNRGISNGVKILIVYATAGAGHKKAAEAIYNEAKQRNLDVGIVDILDYTNCLFKYLYSYGYTLLIKYFPFLWKFIFHITNNPKSTVLKTAFKFINKLNASRYVRFLEQEKFDVIISTQFMCTETSAYIKKKYNTRLINVVTDFFVHGLWYNRLVDKYLVATDKTKDKLVSFGVLKQDITITGIPVDARFSLDYDRKELSRKLGIRPDSFSVLIMTGAIGIGPIKEIVNILKNDAQLLVVCGLNKKLFRQLERMESENLKIFGLVNNVYELMSVSDLIITKPGGMTISEALVKQLPMIFFSIIPGQEANNAKIIESYGAGLILEDLDRIKQIVLDLKQNKQRLEQYRENTSRLARPEAVKDILDIALKQ